MEENQAGGQTTGCPWIEGSWDAGDRLRKGYRGGGSHVSAQSQATGDLERRVASQRRAGISWQECTPAKQTRCLADRGAGTQDRTAGDGTRLFKKSDAAFQGATSARRRTWRGK